PLVPTCRYSLRGIATAFSSEDSGDHRARHSFPTRRSSDLHPEETVFEVAVGAQRSDTFPLLIVTDRRVLHVMDRLRGWTVLEEAPAAAITGAELEERLLSGRLRVHVREGRSLTMKVAERNRSQEVVDLLQHLAAGGAPPG